MGRLPGILRQSVKVPEPTDNTLVPYHTPTGRKTPSDAHKRKPEERPFIAWDGEGINLNGEKNPQSYILFGCSTGEFIQAKRHLHIFEILEFIIGIGERYPDAFHVGFAFGYDSNMIVRSLHSVSLKILHTTGYVRIERKEYGTAYGIKWNKGKSLTITKYKEGYNRDTNPHAKITVRIDDMFSFFTCKFTTAYEQYLGKPVPTVVESGKQSRGGNTLDDMTEVIKYWEIEIKCMQELAEELRKRLYGAGLPITQWHGPGALASYVMKKHNIKARMVENNDAIRLAARHAYAGGRFELFRIGRFEGPIYSYDINSAYPAGIAELPSLIDGEWQYETEPQRIAKFGVYRIRMLQQPGFAIPPGVLFHRDIRHEISFPWYVEGWYWGPEARIAKAYGAEILEGWHYLNSEERPFAWVAEMYETRKQWKREKNQGQLALKLTLNSLYGKMAQRVGYDEKTGRKPPFHQLEWAGWVTSNTRAKLAEVLLRLPLDALIAVETDGLYTTVNPAILQLAESVELGGWEISEYSEILYVQSGLAWLNSNGTWNDKRRGLDPESFSLDSAQRYLQSLAGNANWEPFVGKTQRFIGLGQALSVSAPLKFTHCRWVTSRREIHPGAKGKRIHIPAYCDACAKGATAYDMPHTLVVTPASMKNPHSYPHSIPWEPEQGHAQWRDYEQSYRSN